MEKDTATRISWPTGDILPGGVYWTDTGVAYTHRDQNLYILHSAKGRNGVQRLVIPVPGSANSMLMPSPDRKLAMLRAGGSIVLVDVETARKLDVDIRVDSETRHYWWQSNTEIGYTDSTGARHILKVVP